MSTVTEGERFRTVGSRCPHFIVTEEYIFSLLYVCGVFVDVT